MSEGVLDVVFGWSTVFQESTQASGATQAEPSSLAALTLSASAASSGEAALLSSRSPAASVLLFLKVYTFSRSRFNINRSDNGAELIYFR